MRGALVAATLGLVVVAAFTAKNESAIPFGLATLLIGTTTLLLVVLYQTDSRSRNIAERLASLERASKSERVVLLTSEQVYHELLSAALGARTRIYTSYFGAVPPDRSGSPKKREYFAQLHNRVSTRPEIVYRRLVLLNEDNFLWIQELVETMKGHKNMSLAVFRPRGFNGKLFSISLFDDERAVVVNTVARSPGQLRDLSFAGKDVVQLLDLHYEAMWEASDCIVRNGAPTDRWRAMVVLAGRDDGGDSPGSRR